MRAHIGRTIATGLVALACLLAHTAATAAFPDRQVRLIVPQAPGGASDALGRIVAQKLSEAWGQPVVVMNRAGAGGNIGLDSVAKSTPDGYTLLMSYEGTQAINVSLYKHLSFDPVKDFIAVATVATVPFMCVVNNDVKATTFQQFVELARSPSSKLTFGSAGSGTVNHLLGEMVNSVAKIKVTHIPYKGAAPAMSDLLGGRIDAVYNSVPSVAAQIEAGTVRALAISSGTRSPRFPNVPTIAESGFPGFDVSPWFGLFVPAGTPDAIVTRINEDVGKILSDPLTLETFAAQGATPLQTTPAQFKKILDTDVRKWETLVKESGATVD